MKNLDEYEFKALDATELVKVQGGGFFEEGLGALGSAIDWVVGKIGEALVVITADTPKCQ
jgi:hypothetical protein